MFGIPTPQGLAVYAVAAGIILVTGFGSGWKVNEWRHKAQYADMMEGGRVALEKTAEQIAKIDIKQQTIYQKVQTNVIEKQIYRECKHDPDTLRLLNDALTNGQQGSDKGKLPGESRSFTGRFFRSDDSETNGSK